MTRQQDLRFARYLLRARFGVRNADQMSNAEVMKEIERNPALHRYDKYLDIDGHRFRLTRGSPQKTKKEAEYYAQNISRFGFYTRVIQGINEDAWLVYARRYSTGNKVHTICMGCQRKGTAFKSQIGAGGYVSKGMTLGCPKCGGNMKKYTPWW